MEEADVLGHPSTSEGDTPPNQGSALPSDSSTGDSTTEQHNNDSSNIDSGDQPANCEAKTSVQHLKTKEDIELQYSVLKKIGGGAQGAVFLAEDKQTHNNIAIKSILCTSEEELEDTVNEINFLTGLRHQNVVDHLGGIVVKTDSFLEQEKRIYLLMEYVDGGSLEQRIKSAKRSKTRFADKDVLMWVVQVAECLQYLHEMDVIHRDIKTENILLSKSSQTIKVCDFGFSKKFNSNALRGSTIGTIVYMAPELFSKKKYDESVDIWALGVCAFQLMKLMEQEEVPDIRQEITRDRNYLGEVLGDTNKSPASKKLISVVLSCCTIDPTERPTAGEIVQYLTDKIPVLSRRKSSSSVIIPRGASYIKIATAPGRNLQSESANSQDPDCKQSGDQVSSRLNTPRRPSSAHLTDLPSPNQGGSPNSATASSSKGPLRTTYSPIATAGLLGTGTLGLSGRLASTNTDTSQYIENKRARKFWEENGWKSSLEVNWMEFREAYQRLMRWQRMSKEQERGLKKLLCVEMNSVEIITCHTFNSAIRSAGFPFDMKVLTGIDKYREMVDESKEDDTNSPSTSDSESFLSPEQFKEMEQRYLTMILEHDSIFVDPISQEALSVEHHCAPLQIVSDKRERLDLIKNKIDMDYEEERLLRRDRLSSMADSSSSQRYPNAVDHFTALPNSHRFIVLGPAACGKTVLMRLIMFKVAQKAKQLSKSADGNDDYLIPVFIPISNLSFNYETSTDNTSFEIKCLRASADSLLNRGLKYHADIEQFLLQAMRTSRALLLFDGMDEAPIASIRNSIRHNILRMAHTQPQLGIIITSRVSGFASSSPHASMRVNRKRSSGSAISSDASSDLSSFMASQVEEVDSDGSGASSDDEMAPHSDATSESSDVATEDLDFGNFEVAKVQPLTYEMQIQIARRRGVNDPLFDESLRGKYKELAKTPLLLSLMIQEFKMNNGALPAIRAQLYAQAIRTMIDIHFDKYRQFDSEAELTQEKTRVMEFLASLSLKLHGMRRRDFEDKDIEQTFTNGIEVDHLQTWLQLRQHVIDGHFSLIMCTASNRVFRFSHLSFQEYFVASVWANPSLPSDLRQTEKGLLGFINKNKKLVFSDNVRVYLTDPWYRETLLLCAGQMEQQDFRQFCKHALDAFKRTYGIIDNVIMNMIMERPPSEQAQFNDLEKRVVNDKRMKVVREGLLHPSKDLREMAIARMQLWSNNKKVTEYLFTEMTRDPGSSQSEYAAQALVRLTQKGDRSVINQLLFLIDKGLVLDQVAWALGKIAQRGDTLVVYRLIDMLNNKQLKVRIAAAESLGDVSLKGAEDVVGKLMELLGDKNIRAKAAYALGFVAEKGDKKVMAKLLDMATTAKVEEAVISLGRLCERNDVGSITKIVGTLQENSFDEQTIIQALSLIAPDKGNELIISQLIKMFDHPRRAICYRAASVLGHFVTPGDDSVIDKLLALLEESRPTPPQQQLQLQQQQPPHRASHSLDLNEVNFASAAASGSGSSNSPSKKLTDKVAFTLGFVALPGDVRVLEKLLDLLAQRDSTSAIIEKVTISLGKIAMPGDSRVLEKLLELFHSHQDDEDVFIAVTEALQRVAVSRSFSLEEEQTSRRTNVPTTQSKDQIEDETSDREDPGQDQPGISAELKSTVIAQLRRLLGHPNPIINERVIEALGRIAEREDRDVLNHILENYNLAATNFAPGTATSIGGGSAAFIPLRAILCEAIGNLASVGDEHAIQILLDFTGDDAAFVREKAVVSLGRVTRKGDSRVIERLVSRTLLDEDEAVRAATEAALVRVSLLHQMTDCLRGVKELRPQLFQVVIRMMHELRQDDLNWKMPQSLITALQRTRCLEATFVMLHYHSGNAV